jgi:acetylornithine deacetylase/succinyl-diaminopimelate desuccinylase-like protein
MSWHGGSKGPPRPVPAPSDEALSFHRSLPGYAPTPVHRLPAVALKDESDRLGLPAFKVLGASWAVERTLREDRGVHTLVAASAGNHGRAVAHVAARRGLAARIHLPARSSPARRAAIAEEGADVVVVDGTYEDAVAQAAAERARDGVAEIAGLVRAAAAAELGATPPVAGASYWADAAFIAAAGIPTVMFGPGGEGAHATEEWVSLADTEAVTRTLVAVAGRLCA